MCLSRGYGIRFYSGGFLTLLLDFMGILLSLENGWV